MSVLDLRVPHIWERMVKGQLSANRRNRRKAHEQGEDGAMVANRTDHTGQKLKVGKGMCSRCRGHRNVSPLGCEGHGRTLDATLLHWHRSFSYGLLSQTLSAEQLVTPERYCIFKFVMTPECHVLKSSRCWEQGSHASLTEILPKTDSQCQASLLQPLWPCQEM